MVATENPRSYIEAKIRVPRPQADAICNFIIENIASGLILEDEDGSDETTIVFYIRLGTKRGWQTALRRYLEHLPEGSLARIPPVKRRIIEDIEWVKAYRASVKPVLISPDVVVRPSWVPVPAGVTYDIIIEPGMAFGTGSHETTRSCLAVIRHQFRAGMRFLDVGCGSGILSVLAAKMGASFVKSIDTDVIAVECCRKNFEVNRIKAPSEIRVGSVDVCLNDVPYDFVCANIIKTTIVEMMPDLHALTTGDGVLVLSGLLTADESEIITCLRRNGMTDFTTLREGDWLTFTVRG